MRQWDIQKNKTSIEDVYFEDIEERGTFTGPFRNVNTDGSVILAYLENEDPLSAFSSIFNLTDAEATDFIRNDIEHFLEIVQLEDMDKVLTVSSLLKTTIPDVNETILEHVASIPEFEVMPEDISNWLYLCLAIGICHGRVRDTYNLASWIYDKEDIRAIIVNLPINPFSRKELANSSNVAALLYVAAWCYRVTATLKYGPGFRISFDELISLLANYLEVPELETIGDNAFSILGIDKPTSLDSVSRAVKGNLQFSKFCWLVDYLIVNEMCISTAHTLKIGNSEILFIGNNKLYMLS